MSSGLGAIVIDRDRTLFRVWAPAFDRLEIEIVSPTQLRVPLQRDARGYHEALVDGAGAGTRYYYQVPGGRRYADPASRSQPDGVHGPSEVVDLTFAWNDRHWESPDLADLVIYELHVGAFTKAGTFEAVIDHLGELADLGVTAIELMPIAQFPGARNWGYDGVFPFAPQNTYGGPAGLQRLIDAAHESGLAVILDVVYNHLGPEGNILADFAPYFISKYHTPWGEAINFDAADSDDVRNYFIENARQWLFDYHFDALRLDAVHAILDTSAYPFLTELADRIHDEAQSYDRRAYLIAESDLNDPRLIRPRAAGGHGLDAQWSDDYHHSLHTLLTGESVGYYADFGELDHLIRAYREGFTYTGEYSPHRRRRHGAAIPEAEPKQFVVAAQNHDQIGNRMMGDRLTALVDFEAQKLAAAALLTAPFVPLMFMGEEYGELAPFPYFVSHSNPQLVEAVRNGRRQEFESFGWKSEPPDPFADSTFASAQLSRHLQDRSPHRELKAYYQHLLAMRRELQLNRTPRGGLDVQPARQDRVLVVTLHTAARNAVAVLLNFNAESVCAEVPLSAGKWHILSDSAAAAWAGPGPERAAEITSPGAVSIELAPWSALVLQRVGA